ncbi:hypothetical protein ACFOYW_00450 [Gryllotalpicola reticulitermitis]|uniref:Uncharacterized protein n=1 Tax=Gryllotalpicola reticulitermitis TaxID=1184153 RepID=A0ABV8Q0B9_9MICO
MSAATMDPVFAAAVERELATLGAGKSRLERRQRRTRTLTILLGGIALAGAITGAAAVVSQLPGTTTTESLSNPVSVTHTGTGTIDLGPAPAHAAAVILHIQCLSTGTIRFVTEPQGPYDVGPDYAGMTCTGTKPTPTNLNHITAKDAQLPPAGSTSITITATPGTKWTATARYASQAISPWKVNAHGQTYGVDNKYGQPDLQSAQATNGKLGYIYTKDFLNPKRQPPTVYASNGTTVLGHLRIESDTPSTTPSGGSSK